jgi:putative glycosyltransferase (TIGR04372 family)
MKSFSAHIEEISSGGLTIFQRKMRSLLLNELLPSLKPETYFTLLLAIRIIIRSRLIGSVLYYSDQLYAQRIGHLAYNIESCLLSINADTNKLYYSCLLLHQNKPSNEFLIKVWKRNPNLTIIRVNPLTHRLLNFILEKLKSYMPVKKIDWEKLHPTANLDSLSPSIFSLDAQDLLARRSMLINLGINSSLYVSMHNRDAGYLLKRGQDGNYHDYRDFDFGSLTLLINYLSSRGVFTVRHGKYQLSPTNKLSSQLLIDLSNKSEMDSHDVLLVSDSLFFVGCSTGFSMIPRLFRKPCLLVNYVPFRLDEVCMMSPNSIFLPKLFSTKKKNVYYPLVK